VNSDNTFSKGMILGLAGVVVLLIINAWLYYCNVSAVAANLVVTLLSLLAGASFAWLLERSVRTRLRAAALIHGRDIAERKAQHEALARSEIRLRGLFESNVAGMIRWDLNRSLILDAKMKLLAGLNAVKA
jgi:PAS domain-containing protein